MTAESVQRPPGGDRGQPGVRRARLDPETRRAQLIATALRLLDERGLEALTVEEVADAAGVSRSLVYSYFGDRDGLAAEVYLRILERLDEELGLTLPFDESALERMVGECMAFAQRYRAAWHMVVSDPARQHALVRDARAARAVRLSSSWSEHGRDQRSLDLVTGEARVGTSGTEPGSADDGRCGAGATGGLAGPPLAAEAVLGMLEAGVQHWLDHPEVPAQDAASLLAALLWCGLRGANPS
jgi:AcrR family transcriptional regulator